jgi:hypothetical protein
MVVEEVENQISTVAANGIRWGTRSVLLAALSYFPKLELELELLGSRRDAYLSNDQVDALWPFVSVASDLLASLLPSSLPREPPNDVE